MICAICHTVCTVDGYGSRIVACFDLSIGAHASPRMTGRIIVCRRCDVLISERRIAEQDRLTLTR